MIDIIYFDKRRPREGKRELRARRDSADRQVHAVSVQREGVGSITFEFTHLESLETVSSTDFKIASNPSPPVLNRGTALRVDEPRSGPTIIVRDAEIAETRPSNRSPR